MDQRSPHSVSFILPCFKQPLSILYADAEEEEGNYEDADENDDAHPMCDWKDQESDKLLTFKDGNLHYNANWYN